MICVVFLFVFARLTLFIIDDMKCRHSMTERIEIDLLMMKLLETGSR